MSKVLSTDHPETPRLHDNPASQERARYSNNSIVTASRVVLAFFVLYLIIYALFYVPRLANPLWSNAEFTGWVSPIAHRMLEGERIYHDFTLPIPPASFTLMAAIQWITGRFLLLDELWLCATCQLIMLAIGYWLVRPFTTARNATLVVLATAPVLISAPKEIAYDHTAQVSAWASLALVLQGLVRPHDNKRMVWMAAAGLAAGSTLAFKSSTGVGAMVGVFTAMLVVCWVGLRRDGKSAFHPLARDISCLTGGIGGGLVATAAAVLFVGGSLEEFYHVVFVDGPNLKGGRSEAFYNLLSYTIIQTPTHISFLSAMLIAYVFARIVGNKNALVVDNAASSGPVSWERGRAGWVFALPMVLFLTVVFGLAILLLAGNADRVPLFLQLGAGFGGAASMIGLFTLALFLGINLMKAKSFRDRSTIFAALTLGAGILSLMHNLSDPKHRPLYDNNPIIPLAIASLLLLCDEARARILKYTLICLMVIGLFSEKFNRYLIARYPVDDDGYWRGLRISDSGKVMLDAAKRVRRLAGRTGTVLVLPEDPMYEALIGRPRPKLRGGIVFVDQFPEHVLEHDLSLLNAQPPAVVVLHPDNDVGWLSIYKIWSANSPAARLQTGFMRKHRHATYRVVKTYPTWLFESVVSMSILARKDLAP